MDIVQNLGNQLFQLQMLQREGKHVDALIADVEREIQEEICRSCPDTKKHKRNSLSKPKRRGQWTPRKKHLDTT